MLTSIHFSDGKKVSISDYDSQVIIEGIYKILLEARECLRVSKLANGNQFTEITFGIPNIENLLFLLGQSLEAIKEGIPEV